MSETWVLVDRTEDLPRGNVREVFGGRPVLTPLPVVFERLRSLSYPVAGLSVYAAAAERDAAAYLSARLLAEWRGASSAPSGQPDFASALEYRLKSRLDALMMSWVEIEGFQQAEKPNGVLILSPSDPPSSLVAAEGLASRLLRWSSFGSISYPTSRRRRGVPRGRLVEFGFSRARRFRNRQGPRTLALSDHSSILHWLERHPGSVDWWLDRDGRAWRSGCLPLPVSGRAAVDGADGGPPAGFFEQLIMSPELPPPVRKVFREDLEALAHEFWPKLRKTFRVAQRYARKRRPELLLIGSCADPLVQLIVQGIRSESDARVIGFQHGGNYGYVRMRNLALTDLRVPDLFLAWGMGCAKALSRDAAPGTHVEPLRPALPNRPDPSIRSPGWRVLYIATAPMGDGRYGPAYWQSDIEYWEILRSSVEKLEESGFVVHVRPNPKGEIELPLEELGLPVEDGRSLGALLEEPWCAVVLDWPSTALLEALRAGHCVVWIDAGWLAPEPTAKALLERAVLRIAPEDVGSIRPLIAGGWVPSASRFLQYFGAS